MSTEPQPSTWRDRLVSTAPFSRATATALKEAWLHTLGEVADRFAVLDVHVPELTARHRTRIAAVIAECRDEDIRRRFPPFGVAA